MRGRRGRAALAELIAALVLVSRGRRRRATTAGAPTAASANDPVIVVNGLFGVGFAYEPLVARLRADGYQVGLRAADARHAGHPGHGPGAGTPRRQRAQTGAARSTSSATRRAGSSQARTSSTRAGPPRSTA